MFRIQSILVLLSTGAFGKFVPFDQSLPCLTAPMATIEAGSKLAFQ